MGARGSRTRWQGGGTVRAGLPALGAAALLACGAVRAQEADPAAPAPETGAPPGADAAVAPTSPILTLDQDRLFRESAWGSAAVARAEADTAALAAENRRIETALEAEEKDLTQRRPTLAPEEFAPLAEAFDAKVEEIRAAQDAKSRAITRRLEEDRKAFFEASVPMLGQLLADSGAVAILADQAIILSLTSIDVTDAAIARMNAALPAVPPAAPVVPDPAPQAGPTLTDQPAAP